MKYFKITENGEIETPLVELRDGDEIRVVLDQGLPEFYRIKSNPCLIDGKWGIKLERIG